jgi:hypothetical protein
MASSIQIRILFYLLFSFTIIDTINSYHLHDLQNSQQIRSNHAQFRSVLWPKICITILKRFNNHQHSEDENNHITQRSTRKCYPSDMR